MNSNSDKVPIQVSLRIKPFDHTLSDHSILEFDPSHPKMLFLSQPSESLKKPFTFDNIFSETASQSSLFSSIAEPLLNSCLQGYNVCIFAYGQTGAGKTYTITGGPDEEKGVLPRSIDYIFQNINNQKNKDFIIKISYLEIYNEQIIDLLDPNKKNLSLREDVKKGVYVEGLSEERTFSSYEAQELLKKGSNFRHIGSTTMNRESSRSHSVFTIAIEAKEEAYDSIFNGQIMNSDPKASVCPITNEITMNNDTISNETIDNVVINNAVKDGSSLISSKLINNTPIVSGVGCPIIDCSPIKGGPSPISFSSVKHSKISFVDLAGSERQKHLSGVSGDRLKEGCNINKSLHVLGNVINALVEVSEGKTRHIHYRDSKLTFLLKDSLGGNSKTSLIANLNAGNSYFQETFSTIKFAKRVKMIKNIAFINEESLGNVESLKEEISRLKKELKVRSTNEGVTEIRKVLGTAIEREVKLQTEIKRNQEEANRWNDEIAAFKGMEEEYRFVIELMNERLKRQSNFDLEAPLMKENTTLKNLLKRTPFLAKLHQENIFLRSELKKIEENLIFANIAPRRIDFNNKNEGLLIKNEACSIKNEGSQNNEQEISIKSNNDSHPITNETFPIEIFSSQNNDNSIFIKNEPNTNEQPNKVSFINTNGNLKLNFPNKNQGLISISKDQDFLQELKSLLELPEKEKQEEMVKKTVFEEMRDYYNEKIELLNLELIECRPKNGLLNEKLSENQEFLDLAYEKIGFLEGELEALKDEIQEIQEENNGKEAALEGERRELREKLLEKELMIEQLEEGNKRMKEKIGDVDILEENLKEKERLIDELMKKSIDKEILESKLKENEKIIEEMMKKSKNKDVLQEKERIIEEFIIKLKEKDQIIIEKGKLVMDLEEKRESNEIKYQEKLAVFDRNAIEKENFNLAIQQKINSKDEFILELEENLQMKENLVQDFINERETLEIKLKNLEKELFDKTKLIENFEKQETSYKSEKKSILTENKSKDNLLIELKQKLEEQQILYNSEKESILIENKSKDNLLIEYKRKIEEQEDFYKIKEESLVSENNIKENLLLVYKTKLQEEETLYKKDRELLLSEYITKEDYFKNKLEEQKALYESEKNIYLSLTQKKLQEQEKMNLSSFKTIENQLIEQNQKEISYQETIKSLNEVLSEKNISLLNLESEKKDLLHLLQRNEMLLEEKDNGLCKKSKDLHSLEIQLLSKDEEISNFIVKDLQKASLINEKDLIIKQKNEEVTLLKQKFMTIEEELSSYKEKQDININEKIFIIKQKNEEIGSLNQKIMAKEEELSSYKEKQDIHINEKNLIIKQKNEEIGSLNQKIMVKEKELSSYKEKEMTQEEEMKSKELLNQNLINNKEIIIEQKNQEIFSQQDYSKSLEKAHEDLQKKCSFMIIEQGLSTEKFEALQKAHESLQIRYEGLEHNLMKKQGKLQKDLEIKANNSQELLKKIDSLGLDNEKLKKKYEKTLEEMAIRHGEEIKSLYDERKEQLEKLMKEKVEVTEGEIEKFKKLISNLKKQNENLEKELEFKEDLQKKASSRLFKDNERLKEEAKGLLKDKDRLQKDLIDKEDLLHRKTQKVKTLVKSLQGDNEAYQRELREKEVVLLGLKEKAEEHCRDQERDFEQIKMEYDKIREENCKLKGDLALENDKLKRLLIKETRENNNNEFRNEIERKNSLIKSFMEGVNKLNNIISINGFQRYHNMSNNSSNSSRGGLSELEGIIQGVQFLISGALDKENKIKEKERELDSKNLKYSIMEREYLLQKQKLHILQQSERRKEKESSESIEKNKGNLQINNEALEKITLRERGNSLNKMVHNAGLIYKKH